MLGTLVIISAPSGGGKTVITRALLQEIPTAVRLITTTTRPLRPGEVNGVDYHFLTRAAFEEKIAAGDFIEYVEYAGAYYGTDRLELQQLLEKWEFVIAVVDIRGKEKLVAAGFVSVSIFILPENVGVLKNRLAHRDQVSNEYLTDRLARAQIELAAAPAFDYQVINREGHLAEAVAEVRTILAGLRA